MTGVCSTWLHSASSLWFPCKFWQEFLQSCLREVLENAVGKQPPGYCWLSPQIPWRGHLERLLWCPYLTKGWTQGWPPRPWPQPYFWSEQWPGIALLFLASSWLLWARAQLWLNHFILVICPGIVTPAPILLESFLTEPHFGFLVPFQFYAPRKPNQPRSFQCIDCLPALLLLHFHLEIWENLGYSWTCFYLHRWYWWWEASVLKLFSQDN